ncbi:MAG: GNAT family N-acetyltransferase [Burkholderiales bacterium]|jgi:diamine N-acetyltransferase|nr:GNAT family N-acetyltransferase [Betaproteobacteria bacterium]
MTTQPAKPAWPRTLQMSHVREHHAEFVNRVEKAAMANQTRPLTRESIVTLREITAETARSIMFLDVAPHQDGLVAPNAVSMAQAHFAPQAWMRAIYADEAPVGFLMLEDSTLVASNTTPDLHNDERYIYLWRFMVDARYQQLGYGAQAISAAIAYARTRPGVKYMLLSFVPAEQNPEPIYARFGFVRTGEIDDGEVVMALAL